MTESFAPIPVQDPLVEKRNPKLPAGKLDPNEGQCTDPWRKWLQSLSTRANDSVEAVHSVSVSGQSSAISDAVLYNIPYTGLYRVIGYARVTEPSNATSTMGPFTLSWVDDGVSLTDVSAGTTITTNSITSQTSIWCPFHADGGTQILYSVGYDSTGSVTMQFKFYMVLEAL